MWNDKPLLETLLKRAVRRDIGANRYESNKRKRDQPQPQRIRVAVLAERSQGESSQSVNRIGRLVTWDIYNGERL